MRANLLPILVAGLVGATAAFGPALAQDLQGAARADADGDGYVSRAEFAAARAARFGALDRNGDGVISRDDFRRIARRSARLKQMIGAFDRNGDGRITREEFASAPMPAFDRADADRDGRLDTGELAALRPDR